jgi:hypothetical protein
MIYNIYAMRDELTGFLPPTYDINDAVAMRNFRVAILRSSDSIHYMPSDYSLYRLGLYDSDTGRLIVDEVPTFLMRGEPAADSAPAAKPKRTTKTTQK